MKSVPPTAVSTAGCASTAATIACECLAVRVRVLSRAVTCVYDEVLRPHGLKVTQMNLLVALAVRGPSRPAGLCQLLHLERSTFSRTIERMRRQGWVETSPDTDARTYRVAVTEAGTALLERAKPDWELAQDRARGMLGEATARALTAAGSSLMGVRHGGTAAGGTGRPTLRGEERA
jgi:DNA-binding MarR family transcriptional regulator